MNTYWLALSYLDGRGVGPANAELLLDAFGDPENVFRQSAAALKDAGASERAAVAVAAFRDGDKVRQAQSILESVGATVLTKTDERYPKNLFNIEHPPIVLYALGELREEDSLAVAMVGTRKPTEYGVRAARMLSKQIAACRVTVVSGLARGIDAACHEGALSAPEGRTVAVLGCGIDRIYPPENAPLARRIGERGAVLTEFFPGTPPEKENFPRRNRLIAGLSNGIIVVEAGERSGTMISVDWAAKQGKPVFGVPGPIDSPVSYGVHRLLRDGATPVFEAMDVLSVLVPEYRRREGLSVSPVLDLDNWKKALGLTGEAACVLEALTLEPRHVDELAQATSLPAQRLLTALLELELRGAVKTRPGKYYVLNPENS